MQLNEEEYNQFMEIYPPLIFFVAKRKGMIDKGFRYENFLDIPIGERLTFRDKLFENPKLIDEYVATHKKNLPNETIEIVLGFKNFVAGEFMVLKYLKAYSILLNDKVAYGVLGLASDFEDFFGPNLPAYVKTVLLPFKGKIIFDGFLQSYNMRFGGGYKSSFNESYKEAKATYGIVTSLPFDNQPAHAQLSLEEQVRYFMKNADHRERFEKELNQLLKNNPELLPVYHEERGKTDARSFKKQLKPLGLNKAYYAILEGVLICSGVTKNELDETLRKIVPVKKWDWVYIFRA
ncbi:MAG: hypothetical protein AB8B69_23270 [Chitinophagales bacterium]